VVPVITSARFGRLGSNLGVLYLYGGVNGRHSYLRTDSLVTLGDHSDRDCLAEGVRKLDQREWVDLGNPASAALYLLRLNHLHPVHLLLLRVLVSP
jgi:hypothetical protein